MKFFIYLPYVFMGLLVIALVVAACYFIAIHTPRAPKHDDLGIVLSTKIHNLLYYNATRRVVMQLRDGKTVSGTAVFLRNKLTGIKCDDGYDIIRESIPSKFIKQLEGEENMRTIGYNKEVK